MGRQTSATPSVVGEQRKGIKLPNPDLWRGDRNKLTAFLSECDVHFELNSHLFPDDTKKVFFMISHLRETPLLAVQPDLSKRPLPEYLTTHDQFVRYLKTNFGDPDEEGTAARQLNDLKQTGSASDYFSAFQRHVAILKWSDDGNLVDRAKKGLKSHLLDEIARHGRSFGTVKELLEFVIPLDNRLWRRQVEKEAERKREGGIRTTTVVESQRTEKKEEKKWEKGQPSAQGGVQAAMMSTVVKNQPKSDIFINGIKLTTLWDTGATCSYISPKAAAKIGVEKRRHQVSVPVHMFDGSVRVAGPITEFVEVGFSLTKDAEVRSVCLDVTTLCDADVVIGWDWMRKEGIVLDGRDNSVKFPIPTPPSAAKLAAIGLPTLTDAIDLRGEDELEELSPEEQDELFQVVPEQYHQYIDVFNPKKGGETLPPSRSYDLKFELKEGANLKVASLYAQGEDQRRALRDILDREIAAGRIRASNSPYGSPMFMIPKKAEGQWRMVIDYRKLNEATIPDAYPLPLIGQITEELGKARYFSKLDLIGAYQLLRVTEGHEHLTAFRTQYGMFESLVVRDGLRNAPAVFQHFLNEVFRELLGNGVVVYIDDILIYGNTLEELRGTTAKVFEVLRKASLYVKASKCEFERDSVVFLGFVVSSKGVSVNPEYIDAITSFPRPKNLRESRGFIGVVSYYRRFVPNFSKIARPINDLTRKEVPFVWGVEQESAFKELKARMCTAPVLAHFDPTLKTILQTDASFFGWGFIISQINTAGQEHPVAIESGAFNTAQLNYTVGEKEFLAVVEGFRRRRHLLLQVETTVLTDHLNLTYWMEPKQLSPRQGRWVEELANFRFKMVYRPGTQASLPDGLSRRADYHSGKGSTMVQESNLIQGLPKFDEVDATTSELRHLLRALQGTREEPGSITELRRSSRSPLILRGGWNSRGFLTFDDRIYVPNYADARLKIMKMRHDSALAGHPGSAKTLELVLRDYVWIGVRKDVEDYIAGCAVCQRAKTNRQKPHGELKPLEVATKPWSSISMDFIEELPNSHGYNSILVVVDRLTKWAIFIPTTTKLTAAGLSELILDYVVAQHGLPENIVSDRGSKFTSKFWKNLTDSLGIRLHLSTAYHPQTDGQTERTNQ
ncbi:hypothetical protein TREMEDRAFT_30259, partial [Tremella mesenterica DSM 1558]|uniref:uncharacterized protein n=1 Tax=Tremella mesenterica (strain ATCC 24925 / CBS 8224 / DSM 1558 / NBRC 9311 / NRRL Y-6157 / RJB 2259-6 / UBC 559-6) TaxID=578456 RepID=UPI0003F49CDD